MGSERFTKKYKGLIAKDKQGYKNFVRILINIYNTRHNAGKMTPEKGNWKKENSCDVSTETPTLYL